MIQKKDEIERKLNNIENYSLEEIELNNITKNSLTNYLEKANELSKIRNKVIKSISSLLSIDKSLINLKGKTDEKLGIIGKEKAIACEVICSISK